MKKNASASNRKLCDVKPENSIKESILEPSDPIVEGSKQVTNCPEPRIVMDFKERQKFCNGCGKPKPDVKVDVCPYCNYGLTKDGKRNKKIKSVWSKEPWLHFKVLSKSRKVMGEYIALHGWVPQNELPIKLRHKIPENEIWMRSNVYNNPQRRRRILTHEHHELSLMVGYNMSYKDAHKRAEFVEHFWFL